MTRSIASFLYGVTASDPRTLAAAVTLFAAVAAVAGYLPARRAWWLDPMVALREHAIFVAPLANCQFRIGSERRGERDGRDSHTPASPNF